MATPHLTRQDLESQIQRLGRHTRRMVAVYGTGEAAQIPLEGKGMVEVIPVRSELELRAQLPPVTEAPYRAYLVPFAGVLPADVGGRFIDSGRIARIGPAAKLKARTGVAVLPEDAAQLRLASYMLRAGNPRTNYSAGTQSLSPDRLVEIWLRTDYQLPIDEGLAPDALLAFCAVDPRGPEFVAEMETPSAEGVKAEVDSYFRRVHGEAAAVIWDRWCAGRGSELMAFAIVAEALVSSDFSQQLPVWSPLKLKALGLVLSASETVERTKDLGQLARPAVSWLRSNSPESIPALLQAAEDQIAGEHLDEFLIQSTRLPRAWKLRLKALGEALGAVASEPTRKNLDAAISVRQHLEKHDRFLREETVLLNKHTEMALRIAAWLTARPDQKIEMAPSSYSDVELLGTWYAEEGGYLDWARRAARREKAEELRSGIALLLDAADREREDLDRRFAAALSEWIAAGRPQQNVLPIDQAMSRVAARFLEQDPERKLLILLMDGMAWAQAVELLKSMGEAKHWGPLVWHRVGKNRVGRGHYPAMIAALPTVTEVSRAAFFAGAVPKNGSVLNTSKDDERLATNKALQPFFESHVKPKLFLRGDGHTADGGLSSQALHAIQSSKEQRLVGIVVNAIDSSLKGDSQQESSWTVESIRSLPQILDEARESGRHILLAADHGHVPSDRLQRLEGRVTNKPRYRKWEGEGDSLLPGERKFSGPGVYLEKGAEAVVLLEHDGVRYGGAAHAGEHGGAALAEVIAPCVLLGWQDDLLEKQDGDLALQGLSVPDWWTLSLPEDQEILRTEQAPKRKRKGKDILEGQTALPGIQPAAPAPEASPPSSRRKEPIAADLLPEFYECEMLKARASSAAERRKVVQAVHFLHQRGNAAPSEAFASHLGIPGFQASSYVGKLQGVLNLDGFEVLRFDRTHKQVFLNVETLEQQFDVKL